MRRKWQCRIAAICLVVLSVCEWAAGAQGEWATFARGATISPDGRYLAFFAGPLPSRPRGAVIPRAPHLRLFAVDLQAGDVICFPEFLALSYALAWQPKDPGQLFAVENLYDAMWWPHSRIVGFTPGKEPAVTFAKKFGEDTEAISNATG